MKFSLEWLDDFVDTAAAGGAEGVRRLLDQAGIPVESIGAAGADTVLDAEITPNRPDAMGHQGLAREIAAMAGLPPRDIASRYAEPAAEGESTEQLTSIVNQVPRLCRRFGARLIRGVANGPAGDLVRRRLAAIGAKSISAAVDATNYVLWDTGQPLHAFDYDKLAGGLLIVRKAARGEKLVTLDGVERKLEPSDVVVADGARAISLAGIMGGFDTAVTAETKNVLLEAAWWDPVTVRKTARRLGMHTDASHRFERGADHDAIPGALALAARLLVEAAGGTVAPGLLDGHGAPLRVRKTALRLARLRMLSGDGRLNLDFAEQALGRLGFQTERRGKRLAVSIPLFRGDVRREDDLVEEVLRVYGYDRLPSRLPPSSGPGVYNEPRRQAEERLADDAAASGLFETVNTPFVDRDADESAWGDWLRLTETALEPLSILNPLDASRHHLRATLLPGLLDAVSRNLRHGAPGVGLFEVGRAFGAAGQSDRPESYESRRFAFAVAGEQRPHWSVPEDAAVGRLLRRQGSRRTPRFAVDRALGPVVEARFDHGLHAARGGDGPHPRGRNRGGRGPRVGRGARAPGPRRAGLRGRDRRRRPSARPAAPSRSRRSRRCRRSTADLSFAQSRELSWETIEAFVRGQGLADLESLRCLDRYEGRGVPAGRVKTTLRLTFRSKEKTLSQEDVNRRVQGLAEELRKKLEVTFA